MFSVMIQNLDIRISGCPESGVDAVDFRMKYHLPPAPTNKIDPFGSTDRVFAGQEPLVRELIGHADGNADLVIGYSNFHFGSRRAFTIEIDPAVLSRFSSTPTNPEYFADLIRAIVKSIKANQDAIAAEEAEYKAQREAEKAKAEQEYREQQNREKAEKAAAETDKAAWIADHGSERLRRMAAEGIENTAVYLDERIKHDRPGWRWRMDVCGDEDEPRNVPAKAFGLLDEARKADPVARLSYWTVGNPDYGDSEDESCYLWTGYVALAKFHGRTIVYGGPTDAEIENT